MKTGEMRLHWDADGMHLYQDFPCLNDALEYAGVIYADGIGTLTRLTNWLGDDACPPNQLQPIAEMRAESRRRNSEYAAMEASPVWGMF